MLRAVQARPDKWLVLSCLFGQSQKTRRQFFRILSIPLPEVLGSLKPSMLLHSSADSALPFVAAASCNDLNHRKSSRRASNQLVLEWLSSLTNRSCNWVGAVVYSLRKYLKRAALIKVATSGTIRVLRTTKSLTWEVEPAEARKYHGNTSS